MFSKKIIVCLLLAGPPVGTDAQVPDPSVHAWGGFARGAYLFPRLPAIGIGLGIRAPFPGTRQLLFPHLLYEQGYDYRSEKSPRTFGLGLDMMFGRFTYGLEFNHVSAWEYDAAELAPGIGLLDKNMRFSLNYQLYYALNDPPADSDLTKFMHRMMFSFYLWKKPKKVDAD